MAVNYGLGWTGGGGAGSQQPFAAPAQNAFVSANDAGRMGMAMQQPYVAHINDGLSDSLPPQPLFNGFFEKPRSQFAVTNTINRPYADVGKMSVSVGQPLSSLQRNLNNTEGVVQGFLAGAGRKVGGIFGPDAANVGGNIGEFAGGIAQVPFDIAGAILGSMPSPLAPIHLGAQWMGLSEEERGQIMKQYDGNPFTLLRLVGDVDKENWQEKVQKGEISPLLAGLGGQDNSLGGDFMRLMGLAGTPSMLLQRTWAGVGDAAKRLESASDSDLSPELLDARNRYRKGEIGRDQYLDLITLNGAGFANEWWLNLGAELLTDPANLALGAGTAFGLAARTAKIAQAMKFVESIGGLERLGEVGQAVKPAGRIVTQLREGIAAKSLTETGTIRRLEDIGPREIMDYAAEQAKGQRGGGLAPQIQAAHDALPAYQQLAMTPVFGSLERVANGVAKVLDPISNIGRKGAKPLLNAHISREATQGSAFAFGIKNYDFLQQAFDKVGLRHLFDDYFTYFVGNEAVFMTGDSMANDILSTNRIPNATPTAVARARAPAGAANFAVRMEQWVGDKMTNVVRRTGFGSAESATARARTEAVTKLQRMGVRVEDATQWTSKMDEKGLGLVHALYYGYRVQKWNKALNAARNAMTVSGHGNPLVDRLALIGSSELTKGRAAALREALKTPGDAGIAAAREAVRTYDELASNFLADADGPLLVTQVREWLDEFEGDLTQELSPTAIADLPAELRRDLTDDGYIYGLAPEGKSAYRIHEKTLEDGTVVIDKTKPWIDNVGDQAAPWSLKFQGDGRVQSMLNGMEQVRYGLFRQITSDRIIREVRTTFINTAMEGTFKKSLTEGEGALKPGSGLTYAESRGLFNDVTTKSLAVQRPARGMTPKMFDEIVDANPAAQRIGMTGRDLAYLTIASYKGKLTTVGASQYLTGSLKQFGNAATGGNILGEMAEHMYPLVRFSMNPFFQVQEWIEPWIFQAARGRMSMHAGKEGWINPDTGVRVTLDDIDMISQRLMDRYRASSPESQFDMMERSLTSLWSAKAARDAAQAVDLNHLQRLVQQMTKSTHARKDVAQRLHFREEYGRNLKEAFDAINPDIWLDLEREFGTKDPATIAMRWADEKDPWLKNDVKIANHLTSTTMKPRSLGRTADVALEHDAVDIFGTEPAALVYRLQSGSLTKDEFFDTMLKVGSEPEYVERAWTQLNFRARTGGIDKWWTDWAQIRGMGPEEMIANRQLAQAMAAVKGITEEEFLSRHIFDSPVSLTHEDFVGAPMKDIAAMNSLYQTGEDLLANWFSREADGTITARTGIPLHEATDEWMEGIVNPPEFIIRAGEAGNVGDMRQVKMGWTDPVRAAALGHPTARSIWVPGGEMALRDLSTPWTTWEAHALRSQMIDPLELTDNELKHGLYHKMWLAHQVDMADPEMAHHVYNNLAFAMLSPLLNLTRNEMAGTRFRVRSYEELVALRDTVRQLRHDIAAVGGEVDPSELGFAYSTSPGVAHYIPLDARLAFQRGHMQPDHWLHHADGREEFVPSTLSQIESSSKMASRYLRGTTDEQRAMHERLIEATGGRYGRISEQVVDDMIDLLDGVDEKEFARTIDRYVIDNPDLRLKRGATVAGGPKNRAEVAAALMALRQNREDLAARDVIRRAQKGDIGRYDDNIAFKPWNINGAAYPHLAVPGVGPVTHHLKSDGHTPETLFAYIRNPEVRWRGTATNTQMGRALALAEDMVDDPEFYVRRRTTVYARQRGDPVPGLTFEHQADPFLNEMDPADGRMSDFGDMDHHRFLVRDSQGRVVGSVSGKIEEVRKGQRMWHTGMIWVEPGQQRSGIANWMYREIEDRLGVRIRPSPSQYEPGKELWAQPYRPFGPLGRTQRQYETALKGGVLEEVGGVENTFAEDLRWDQPGQYDESFDMPYWFDPDNPLSDDELGSMIDSMEPLAIDPDSRIIRRNDNSIALWMQARERGMSVPIQMYDYPEPLTRGGVSMAASRMRPNIGQPKTIDDVEALFDHPVIAEAHMMLPAEVADLGVPVRGATEVIGKFEGNAEPSQVIHINPNTATLEQIDAAGHHAVHANQQDAVITTIRGRRTMERLGVKPNGKHIRITRLTPDEVREVYDDIGTLVPAGTIDPVGGSIDFSAYDGMLDTDTKALFELLANKYYGKYSVEDAHIRWYWQDEAALKDAQGSWFSGPPDASFARPDTVPPAGSTRGAFLRGEAGARDAVRRIGRTERPSWLPGAGGAGGGFGGGIATPPPKVALEPLDEFAERIGHRVPGLNLKTAYFGIDLGDPINFNRGVFDSHMVNEFVEHVFYDLAGGDDLTKVWSDFYESLSPDMQQAVSKWRSAGSPRGAGAFKFPEAKGKEISFRPKVTQGDDAVGLRAAMESGDRKTVGAWVRRKIDTLPGLDDADRARLYRMYPDDDALAALFDKEPKIYGGDYRVFDDLMTTRKRNDGLTDPTLNYHGNGGYQWRLWDDRRHVWDPEVSQFTNAHEMARRPVSYLTTSDDVHTAADFFNTGGLPPVRTYYPEGAPKRTGVGPSFMGPETALMAKDGTVVRGATIFLDNAKAILGFTEHQNKTTGTHELVHGLIEPELDPSGRQVVLDDLNETRRLANDQLLLDTDDAERAVIAKQDEVAEVQTALIDAEGRHKAAIADRRVKIRDATVAENAAEKLKEQAATQTGKLKTLQTEAAGKRRAVERMALAPSKKKERLKAINRTLFREQEKLDDLIARRDEALGKVEPLWDEANAYDPLIEGLAEDAGIIRSRLGDAKKEGVDLQKAYDDLATRAPQDMKTAWDREASEHLADQFLIWLATGTVKNTKMRDLFAYIRRAFSEISDWLARNPDAKVSEPMREMFESLTTPPVRERASYANPVPFDATHELMHAATVHSIINAEDAAKTNIQFRRGRSLFERSINHPYFGMYPASYMWGKVLPEMIRALAINPFGIPVPILTQPLKIGPGASLGVLRRLSENPMEIGLHGSPFMGFVNANRVWTSIEQQKNEDPEFRKMMTDPKNNKFFNTLSMLLPATPWDIPVNYPLWMRRFAEWGLDSQDRAAQGRKLKDFDAFTTAGDIASYAFGPKATFDWLHDLGNITDAPIVSGSDPGGLGGLNAGAMVLGASGSAPTPLGQFLQQTQPRLAGALQHGGGLPAGAADQGTPTTESPGR